MHPIPVASEEGKQHLSAEEDSEQGLPSAQ